MRNAFMNTIIDACTSRGDVFIISGDAGLGVFDDFKETSPDRFVNLGVAEQNMAGVAAGLALTGYKVFTYNIVPFTLYRCYEQIRNDICYQRLPVVMIGIGSGVTYAPQGMTHYAVEDIGIAQTLPNLIVFSPMDPIEARLAALFSLDSPDPVYVRLAKRGEPNIHSSETVDVSRPIQIVDGSGTALLFHGSIAPEVMGARALLEKQGVRPRVISLPMVKPLNGERLHAMLEGVEDVVTVEEHFAEDGLGGILAREYARRMPSWRLHTLGVEKKFIHAIKDTAGMRDLFGISAEKIAAYVLNLDRGRG